MSANPVSPAGSLVGFSWRKLLAGRKSALKNLVALGAALALFYVAPIQNQALNALLAGVVGYVAALACDFLDFWLGTVPLVNGTPKP